MPSQMRSQTPTTQPATGVTGDRSTTQTGGAQAAIGNQALQAAMAEKSAGQLSWEAALGEALGSKLYEALSKQLAQDELRNAAESAVGSAMKALEIHRESADVSEQEAADALLRPGRGDQAHRRYGRNR